MLLSQNYFPILQQVGELKKILFDEAPSKKSPLTNQKLLKTNTK